MHDSEINKAGTSVFECHDRGLPFPMRFDSRGEPVVEFFLLQVPLLLCMLGYVGTDQKCLSSEEMTVKTLQTYCRQFDLKVSGNKGVLQAQLSTFSQTQAAWDR